MRPFPFNVLETVAMEQSASLAISLIEVMRLGWVLAMVRMLVENVEIRLIRDRLNWSLRHKSGQVPMSVHLKETCLLDGSDWIFCSMRWPV